MPDGPPLILPGAEPWSAPGGPHGALVIHGFTGTTQSLRSQAEALAAVGFTVELPRLPGHGTSVDDMLDTAWSDWSGHVDAVYADLAARCDKVVVMGLSMGATLALWLAIRHPEIVGVVSVNGAVQPLPELADFARSLIDQGETTMDAVGNDIAKPGMTELAYDRTPLAPLLSLGDGVSEVDEKLATITCPVLVVSSIQDHVVPPTNSEHLAAAVAGPVEVLTLADSFHVATLDHDAERITAAAVDFATRVCA